MKFEMRFYHGKDERGLVGTVCQLLCVNRYDFNIYSYGTAQQHPKDKNSYYVGKMRALEKALPVVLDRQDRKAIWQYFHEHYKPDTETQACKYLKALKSIRNIVSDL